MGCAVALGIQENASQPAFLDVEDGCVCFAGFCLGYEGIVIVFCHCTEQLKMLAALIAWVFEELVLIQSHKTCLHIQHASE